MADQMNIIGQAAPRLTYKASDVARAHRRCAELQTDNPTWPQARVRNRVAREMGVNTRALRYLLGRAERE